MLAKRPVHPTQILSLECRFREQARSHIGPHLQGECVYNPSASTFDSMSTKKSTLWREVTIGGLILRMFR
ncbi:hypothetical protein BSF40_13180 [Pseudomonas sp. ACN5]|nr:hypothetical protein BSF40_13180 [Pseudomonas sp. ACN5]